MPKAKTKILLKTTTDSASTTQNEHSENLKADYTFRELEENQQFNYSPYYADSPQAVYIMMITKKVNIFPRRASAKSGPEVPAAPEAPAPTATSNPPATTKRPKPLHFLQKTFGEKLLKNGGDPVNPKTLSVHGAVIGVYFSAKWCPPCKTFTPMLILLHEELRKAEGKNFEVIFVSLDSSQQAFDDYFSKMPWLAVDYKDEDKRAELTDHFCIKGIPQLLMLDAKTLEVISLSGRDIVRVDPQGRHFPWTEMPADVSEMKPLFATGTLAEAIEKMEREEEEEQEWIAAKERERAEAEKLKLVEAEKSRSGLENDDVVIKESMTCEEEASQFREPKAGESTSRAVSFIRINDGNEEKDKANMD